MGQAFTRPVGPCPSRNGWDDWGTSEQLIYKGPACEGSGGEQRWCSPLGLVSAELLAPLRIKGQERNGDPNLEEHVIQGRWNLVEKNSQPEETL